MIRSDGRVKRPRKTAVNHRRSCGSTTLAGGVYRITRGDYIITEQSLGLRKKRRESSCKDVDKALYAQTNHAATGRGQPTAMLICGSFV